MCGSGVSDINGMNKCRLLILLLFLPILVSAGQMDMPKTKRIVVFSDPHVMAPELLVSEGEAWTNYISGQRKMVDYSQALFDEMVAKIKDEIKPDLVLITGDLTKDGEQLSHKYVISKLDELRKVGIPTLVIPGNHDRGAQAQTNAVSFDGASTTAVAVADNNSIPRISPKTLMTSLQKRFTT